MGNSGVLGYPTTPPIVESVLAVCGAKIVGIDASILTYRYLLRDPGAAAALVKGNDAPVAEASSKEILAHFHWGRHVIFES